MFRVPTYLDRSPIHGFGVFTPSPISAGASLWEFVPEVDWELTAPELEAFPEPYRTRLVAYCYLDDRDIYVLCGTTPVSSSSSSHAGTDAKRWSRGAACARLPRAIQYPGGHAG